MFCHGKQSNGSAIETIYRYCFSKLNSSRSSLVYSLTTDVYYNQWGFKITKHLSNVGIYLSCKLSANDMEIKCKMIHNNNTVYIVIVYMVIVVFTHHGITFVRTFSTYSKWNIFRCVRVRCSLVSETLIQTQVGLGVGSWPSNWATEGSNPKGTRLYFVILLKNVEKILDWHWYNRLKDALMCR